MRVGLGYDLHPLVEGRALILGGVRFEHPRGLAGHSDADVLTHAIIDALLGAAGLGTIGQHFPDSDERYAGASSIDLLASAGRLVTGAGYAIVNIDSTVTAPAPRLQSRLGEMSRRLATALEIDAAQVSVKATDPEGLGSAGRQEGIAAQAVALIQETA